MTCSVPPLPGHCDAARQLLARSVCPRAPSRPVCHNSGGGGIWSSWGGQAQLGGERARRAAAMVSFSWLGWGWRCAAGALIRAVCMRAVEGVRRTRSLGVEGCQFRVSGLTPFYGTGRTRGHSTYLGRGASLPLKGTYGRFAEADESGEDMGSLVEKRLTFWGELRLDSLWDSRQVGAAVAEGRRRCS